MEIFEMRCSCVGGVHRRVDKHAVHTDYLGNRGHLSQLKYAHSGEKIAQGAVAMHYGILGAPPLELYQL